MTAEEYFKILGELEHEVVIAYAEGNKELAIKKWNALVRFQEKEWPGLV